MKLKFKSEKHTIIFEGKPEELNSIKNFFQTERNGELSTDSKDKKNAHDLDKNITSNQKEKRSYPNSEYDLWKTEVECPFCGKAYITKERSTNSFTKCKFCRKAIHLKWATEERGAANSKGFLFVANEPMKFKSEVDEVSEDIPTSDSSIEEIYKWLDEKGVDYSRNSSKEKLLELILKIEMEKTF